jgi:hypothetical protein
MLLLRAVCLTLSRQFDLPFGGVMLDDAVYWTSSWNRGVYYVPTIRILDEFILMVLFLLSYRGCSSSVVVDDGGPT